MLSRPITPSEAWFIEAYITMQCSAELVNARVATEFVDLLIKQIQAFHLTTDNKSLFVTNDPVEVEKVPAGLKSITGLCDWAEYALDLDHSKRLARVAINGSTVVWNASHGLHDGVSLCLLSNWFLNGGAPPPGPFPDTADTELQSEIAAVKDVSENIRRLDACSRVAWSHPPVPRPPGTRNGSLEVAMPYDVFACYNPKTDKFVGLTDALWRSAILAAHALTPDQDSYSCATWVNLRPYMKPTGVGNTICMVVVDAPGANGEWTLAELEAALRRDFSSQMKQKAYLRDLAAYGKGIPRKEQAAAFYDTSNSGYHPMGSKFVDLFLQESVPTHLSKRTLPLGAATIYGGPKKRQFFRSPYCQSVFTWRDANRLFLAVQHGLKHQPTNLKIKDALKELRQFVESLQ
jgi:hypothetical protein